MNATRQARFSFGRAVSENMFLLRCTLYDWVISVGEMFGNRCRLVLLLCAIRYGKLNGLERLPVH